MSSVAVERALILLRYLIDHEEGLSIREASRTLGYSPATVQKLVNALRTQGYVVQDNLTDRYHLGPEAIQLGLIALSRLDVRRVARTHLEALSEETGETVFLAISRDDHIIYIDKVVSEHPIRMDAPLGEDRPYNCTAAGKVLLFGKSQEERSRLAQSSAFESRTENSKIELADLQFDFEQIEQMGWVDDKEEFAVGVRCIAAPVRDHEGQIIASLTISGPSERVKESYSLLIEKALIHAEAISVSMGYRPPQQMVSRPTIIDTRG